MPLKGQIPYDLVTPFEKNKVQSADYYQSIQYYKQLSDSFPQIQMMEAGISDIGKPIHLVVISKEGYKDISEINRDKYTVLLINNAIHPGEPCGVDASMLLARDLILNDAYSKLLHNTVVLIIPMYNISGALNRSATSRANQNGPSSYGFRGNIRHLDLNRDFIKTITKNAQSFNKLFSHWNPDIMIDNHTSNGADYQYTMTLIATQKDKLEPSLSILLSKDLLPYLYSEMQQKSWEMTPYVNARETPDEGIADFLDLARYSSGFAALHHCISFMPETHMLKPYADRVLSTYDFMLIMLNYMHKNGASIQFAKRKAINNVISKTEFPLNWELDLLTKKSLLFKGYEAKYKESLIHGQKRLYYDKELPYEKYIDYYNSYKVVLSVDKPNAYMVPQAYSEIIDRLLNNGVVLTRLEEDKIIDIEMYYIDSYETSDTPFEGKYIHSDIKLKTVQRKQQFYKGDFIIEMNQEKDRYIVETLEPNAPDSFFAWGFFDGILMQKEYFSPYVFEDLAVEILSNNPKLKQDFEKRKQDDSLFASNAYQQLDYIYKNSPYFEDTYKLYPIGRVIEK